MTDAVRGFLKSIPAMTGVAPEPHVVNLSTVDVDGVPDARPLVVKDVGERGWAFSSTKSSRKGSQLAYRSAAAMTFWWPAQVRAVRIRGEVVEATRVEFWQGSPDRHAHRTEVS